MAVQHGYGKMAGTGALVFAYDTGDTRNSYKGEPATNLIPAGVAFAHSTGSGNAATVEDAPEKGPGWKKVTITARGTNFRTLQWTYLSMAANTLYCHSIMFDWGNMRDKNYFIYFDGNGTGIRAYYRPGDYVNTGGTNINSSMPDGKFAGTITHTSNHSHAFFIGNYTLNQSGLNDYFYYKEYQVEVNSHPTSFTAGTRSATEGLIDLTGNTSIDLSNVSFDSSSNIDLDGTDDRMFVGNPPELSLHNGVGTIEAIVKFPRDWTAGSQYPNLVCKGARAGWDTPGWALFGFRDWPNPNNKSWGLGLRNSSNGVRTVAKYDSPTDVYLHLTATMNGETMKLYENGVLVSTQTQTVIPAENGYNVFIGGDDGSNRFPGDIPVVKVYNESLTESQIQSNFNNYRKRFSDLSNYYDNATDGGRWIRWWWYTGVGWPGHEPEALGHSFGTFDSSSHYGFQRLPEGLEKEQVELLAKDGDGNIYKWDFASPSATAQQVWDSFTTGAQGRWNNSGDAWNPEVIAGSFFNTDQDAWQYRESEGVVSFMLDDDTCDCKSTLNAGHAMCGAGWNQQYAQPDGAYLRYGVDTLNDGGCRGPVPERILELYYRLK